jgi:HEPN domain-containing protein
MSAPNKEQVFALLQAGRRDLLTLQLLIESGRAPHETIGFHTQQACEKFMKAVLVLHGIIFDRTHDLIVLHQLLEEARLVVPVDKEKLRALNSYAVQFRYEGCLLAVVPSSECEAIATALEKWTNDVYESK